MTGAFLFFWPIKFFKLYSFSFTHSPTPKPKKNNPKNQKQDKMMVSSKKTLIKSYL